MPTITNTNRPRVLNAKKMPKKVTHKSPLKYIVMLVPKYTHTHTHTHTHRGELLIRPTAGFIFANNLNKVIVKSNMMINGTMIKTHEIQSHTSYISN